MVFGLLKGKKSRVSQQEVPDEEDGAPQGSSSTQGPTGPLTVNEFIARCKKGKSKGLEPTKPELVAYARYLGIDPVADGDLMWIAEEALHAPLPADWTEHHDSGDRVFYYNANTHTSSWTHPLEHVHRETYKKVTKFRAGAYSHAEKAAQIEKMRQECEQAEREAHRELHNWTEHTDDQGQKFFYCRETQHSAWTDPRPAQCHVLYLQMKALRTLGAANGGSQAAPSKLEPLQPLSDRSERSGAASSDRGRKERHSKNDRGSSREMEDASPDSRDADGQEHGRHSSEEEEEAATDRTERRRRKKRKEKDKEQSSSHRDQQPYPSQQPVPPGSSRGAPVPEGNSARSGRNMPSAISPVDEVRAAMGFTPSLPPLGGGMGGLGGGLPGGLPPLNSPSGGAGGGLSQVGRARVKAGIRLQPIGGGAM